MHPPTGLAGRVADCVKRTSTRIQQCAFTAMEAQHGGSSIDSVPFANRSQIHRNVRRVKANPIGRNQFNVAITHIAVEVFLARPDWELARRRQRLSTAQPAVRP